MQLHLVTVAALYPALRAAVLSPEVCVPCPRRAVAAPNGRAFTPLRDAASPPAPNKRGFAGCAGLDAPVDPRAPPARRQGGGCSGASARPGALVRRILFTLDTSICVLRVPRPLSAMEEPAGSLAMACLPAPQTVVADTAPEKVFVDASCCRERRRSRGTLRSKWPRFPLCSTRSPPFCTRLCAHQHTPRRARRRRGLPGAWKRG